MGSCTSLPNDWRRSIEKMFEDPKHDVADLVITVFLRDGGRMLLVLTLLFWWIFLFM